MMEIDEDMKSIIVELDNTARKEIDEYKKIDAEKWWRRVNFPYDIQPYIIEKKINSTHSNRGCLICKEELPYDWPCAEEMCISSGTCSKKCFRIMKKSPLIKHVLQEQYRDGKHRCEMCETPVSFDDSDSIKDIAVYCSEKCRGRTAFWDNNE
jgi:hypothetical protein